MNKIILVISFVYFFCGEPPKHKPDSHYEHNQAEKHKPEEQQEKHEQVSSKSKYVKTDEKKGVQLAPLLLKQFHIKTSKLVPVGQAFRVPVSALVYFEDKIGIYTYHQGWYNLTLVQVLQKKPTYAIIQAKLKPTNRVVTQGVGMLRLIHLEAFGASGEGHGY